MPEFNHGATVSPSVSYNDQGEEYVSFDNAEVEWAGQRNAVLRDFDQHQDELLTFNAYNGQIEHEYGDPAEDFLSGADLPPQDIQNLQDLAGGPENYAAMTNWANTYLPTQYITEFNQLIASNDYPSIQDAIVELFAYYAENGDNFGAEADYSFRPEYEDEYLDQDDEVLQADIQFNESVLEHFSPQVYNTMIQWAAANLPQEYIQQYDEAMDNPNHDHKGRMIDWLYGVYSQHN